MRRKASFVEDILESADSRAGSACICHGSCQPRTSRAVVHVSLPIPVPIYEVDGHTLSPPEWHGVRHAITVSSPE